jgi:arylsulfatase A-like enzyme/lysophospholipase L1-like esterase
MRRLFFGILLGMLSLPGLLLAESDRPNILILMAEDLSPRIGAFGDPVAQTPNIDRLAAGGVRFTNAFTTAGVCAPSRAAHITGMHQASIGAQHMRSSSRPEGGYLAVPPPEVKAYPELLRRAGYYTLTNGKLDYQFSTYAAGSGPFTIWDHEGEDPDWSRRTEGQPFFALINFGMTHESRMFPQNVEKQRAQGWRQVTDPDDVEVPPYYPDTPVIRRDIAQQYDNVHEMDRQVGLWLERLKADGLLDDTIVIWTTDHGDGLPRAKREIYDSGIRVPLVVYWPERWRPAGVKPGSLDQRLLSFIDIAPSVLQWAGVDRPDYQQGVPVLADPEARRDYVFAARDRHDEMPFHERAVSDGRYQYILNHRAGEPGGKPLRYREQLRTMQELRAWFESGRLNAQQAFWFLPRPREELYDLATDPHEVNNLAGDPAYAAELDRLRKALEDWHERVPDLSDEPEPVMAERFWPGGVQPVTKAPSFDVQQDQLVIESATAGASIAYRLDEREPWRLYNGPFTAPAGAQLEAKAVRYGWQESSVTRFPAEAALEAVPLDHRAIVVRGVPLVERSPVSLKFSRFSYELLSQPKAESGFNSQKARNVPGGTIMLRSASPQLRLRFQRLEGLRRGAGFGVFRDGDFFDSYPFKGADENMILDLVNDQQRSMTWEVLLPAFDNVELVSVETSVGFELEPVQPARRPVLAALGDSITHGTGQGTGSYRSWPFLLARKLGWDLYNLAVGGSGVSTGQAETLAGLGPVDVVTLLFGYNDWNGEGNSVEEFENEYRRMLAAVRAAQPGAEVYCITPLVTRRERSRTTDLPIDGFRDAVKRAVQDAALNDPRLHLIEGPSVSSYENLQPEGARDVVHLTVTGAALLAEALEPLLSGAGQ